MVCAPGFRSTLYLSVKRPQYLLDGLKKVPKQEQSVRNCRYEEVDVALRH